MELILASQSPRRRELLSRLGLRFLVEAADVDETMDPNLTAAQEVARLSADKAAAIAVRHGADDVVLAADTVVVLDGKILGKPRDEADARAMLQSLSGRSHQVLTGITVRRGEQILTEVETTDVWFRTMTAGEIAAYLASGEPMDKAGAYGIQGLAGAFIPRIAGDYYNVMGLPLSLACDLLRRVGVGLFE